MQSPTNTLPRVHGQAPADLLKFIAYKKIAANFEEAVELILSKKLVLGEPIVVPFYYTHKQVDPETGEPRVTLELVFGIGSADVDHPYIHCSFNNSIANDEIIVDEDGTKHTLKEVLDTIITQEDVDEAIIQAIDNAGIIDAISTNVINSPTFNIQLQQKIDVVTDMLTWKPFPKND
jgi:hypothetical protein